MQSQKFSRFQSEVLKIVKLTENVKHLKLAVPNNFSFIPGQYVSIIMDNLENGIKLRRPFSMVSLPKETKKGYIELCIKILENGNMTLKIDKLKKADKIELLGPLGDFKISESSKEKNIIFVSTGVGIAPFKSMIPELLTTLENNHKNKIMLLTGYKNEEKILYSDYFKKLEKKYKSLNYYVALSEQQVRVQQLVEKYFDKNADYYICGLKDMVSSVNMLLLKKGVLGKNIFIEKYD